MYTYIHIYIIFTIIRNTQRHSRESESAFIHLHFQRRGSVGLVYSRSLELGGLWKMVKESQSLSTSATVSRDVSTPQPLCNQRFQTMGRACYSRSKHKNKINLLQYSFLKATMMPAMLRRPETKVFSIATMYFLRSKACKAHKRDDLRNARSYSHATSTVMHTYQCLQCFPM